MSCLLLAAGEGFSVESPNPSSALEWFIKSVPTIISGLDLALSTLLCLVPGDPAMASSSGSSNPLFDEDPINEYAEDIVLLQHITGCLRDTLSKHKELPAQDLIIDYLDIKNPITELASDSKGDEDASGSDRFSVWENPKLFMMLVRRHLLQGVLRTTASLSERTQEQQDSTLAHPIFM